MKGDGGLGNKPETQSQLSPSARDKRKTLSKTLDLGNLPSHWGKKVKHRSSKSGFVKPSLPTTQSSVQIFDVDSSDCRDYSIQNHCAWLVLAFSKDSYESCWKWGFGFGTLWESCVWRGYSYLLWHVFKRLWTFWCSDLFKVLNFILASSLSLHAFLV